MILAARTGPRLLLSIVALLCLTGTLLAPIGSAFAHPVSAGQPLCLGETIWDEQQQQCVPIDGASPAPTPSAPDEPETPSPTPAETATVIPAEPSAAPSPMQDDESPLPPGAAFDLSAVSLYSTVYACRDGANWYALADASPFRPNTVPLCTDPAPGLIPFNVRSGG